MSLVTSFGALAPGISTDPMTRSEVDDRAVEIERVGGRGLHPALEVVVEVPEPLDVGVEHGDVGAQADRDDGGVGARHTAADDGHRRRPRAGHSRHQQAEAARGAHQRGGADGRREPTGDLAHRRKQRQSAAGDLHRLVRDGGDAVGEQALGERAVGGQMQVGEQHEVVAEVAVLARDRLLDLQQQLRARPHLRRVVEQDCAGRLVLGVRHGRALAGAALHEHLVAGRHQIVHSRRREGDPVLVVLDLGGDADPHRVILSAPPLERSGSSWERL